MKSEDPFHIRPRLSTSEGIPLKSLLFGASQYEIHPPGFRENDCKKETPKHYYLGTKGAFVAL